MQTLTFDEILAHEGFGKLNYRQHKWWVTMENGDVYKETQPNIYTLMEPGAPDAPLKKLFYFAYGSNLDLQRLEWRIGRDFRTVTTYALPDYKLVFNTGQRENSFASVIPEVGSTVEGAIYEIDELQEEQLDHYEGVAMNLYSKQYFKAVVDGVEINVLMYVGEKLNDKPPSHMYLCIIRQGCQDHKLTRTFNEIDQLINKLYPRYECFL